MALLVSLLVACLILTTSLLLYRRIRAILDPYRPKPKRDAGGSTHLLIVLGSGGHTAEMISMLQRAVNETNEKRRLDWSKYTFRTWVVGTGDGISAQRAGEFEEMAAAKEMDKERKGGFEIVTVPRAREIHQPLYTAPVSSMRCMLACWNLLLPTTAKSNSANSTHNIRARDFPDLTLCNGPATAAILILTSLLLRFFNVRGCNERGKMRTIYIESWARVKKLSLSGKLLSGLVDRFVVQWPHLLERSRRGEYLGVLV